MYNLLEYGKMLNDEARTKAYVLALKQVIHPEDVVLEIGTGTGFFAMLACQFGAKKVYAVEPSEAILVARETATANGYDNNRIEFIREVSNKITLPEQVDVIVSDLRGALPLFQGHLPAIVDARQRFLKPQGNQIPQRDTLWASVVEAPELHRRFVSPWGDKLYGLKLEPARRYTTNHWCKARIEPEQLLTTPRLWANLDYSRIEDPNVKAEVSWTVERPGTAHGLGLWFEAELAEGIGFSNAPGQAELIYGQAFFPWPEAVRVESGDVITVKLQAKLAGDDYIWRWDSKITGADSLKAVKADFHQSTFYGMPLDPTRLRKQAADYRPKLNLTGQITAFVLKQIETGFTTREIAQALAAHYPHIYPNWQTALAEVSTLAQQYSL